MQLFVHCPLKLIKNIARGQMLLGSFHRTILNVKITPITLPPTGSYSMGWWWGRQSMMVMMIALWLPVTKFNEKKCASRQFHLDEGYLYPGNLEECSKPRVLILNSSNHPFSFISCCALCKCLWEVEAGLRNHDHFILSLKLIAQGFLSLLGE